MPVVRRNVKLRLPPEGFRYAPELITRDEETALIGQVKILPLKEFEFHQYRGKRRTTAFGWRYDYGDAALKAADDIPAFLNDLRERAAGFAGLEPERLAMVLVSEYSAGAPIGWHRDRSVFEDVVGVSLASPCVFRFRQRTADAFERHSLILNPRSVYLLRGPARNEWEHSIPSVRELRYSITFRSLRAFSVNRD